MLKGLFRVKTLDEIMAAAEEAPRGLKRDLGPWQVTSLGVGAIIGAGIFSLIGTAAAGDAARPGAGPSLMVSFLLAAIICGFTALCYAEFASIVPLSGTAYTYSYATLGELVAWIIGWDLIIEYGIGNASVAISWSNYLRGLLGDLGVDFPIWLATDFRTGYANPEILAVAPRILGFPVIFNVLASGIVLLLTWLLVVGVKESARFNSAMVVIKLLVLAFFVVAGLWLISPSTMSENWQPFQPNGWRGTFTGAALIFYAFIGFDAVSTVAEETKVPARDLPIGIIASLLVCAGIYVVIAALFTGMVPFATMTGWTPNEMAEPLTTALETAAPGAKVFRMVTAVGAVVSTTAVLLVFQLGQPRIFFSMARDGLLPKGFAKVHPRYGTPHVTTIIAGVVVALFAGVAQISEMADLTNIGTLFAFVLVCIGIPILRLTDPDRPRAFKVPFGPYLFPVLGAASCLFLIYYLPSTSWWRFAGWLALGMAVYCAYGYTHSILGRTTGRPAKVPAVLWLAAAAWIAAAVGMFIIPHHAGPLQLWQHATTAGDPARNSTLVGLGLIFGGLAAAVVGMRSVPSGKPEAERELG
jgi:APA family basic amino acid/polyamine antiporter